VGIGLGHRRVWLDTALDVFRLRKRLLARIHVDSLTGLLNREGWETRAARAFDQAMAARRPVALAYLDLDHFKRTNDTFGHAVGDQLLRAIAATLQSHCSAGELVARVGGEEFVVLLPGADEDAAFAFAERIRHAVAALPGPFSSSVSCGVARHRPGETLEQLVARADAAMLEAKRRGRNMVLRAESRVPTFSEDAGSGAEDGRPLQRGAIGAILPMSVPTPPASFSDFALPAPLLQALADIGYESPSPIQAATIPPLLEGRDVLGQAQTGTGKTAAFALPALARLDPAGRKPQVLVLTPTRELAIQVAEAFQKYATHLPGFHILPIYGGQGYGQQFSALKRGVQVVVGT